MLRIREQIRVQQRQLNGILNRVQSFLLPANFFPREFWHSVEIIILGMRSAKAILPRSDESDRPSLHHQIFKFSFIRLRTALNDDGLHSHVPLPHPEPVTTDDFGYLCHWSARCHTRDRPRSRTPRSPVRGFPFFKREIGTLGSMLQ